MDFTPDYSNGKQYKNGMMGTIVRCNKKSIRVLFDDKGEVTISYRKIETENGFCMCIPLALGYAITTEKSQGMTFDAINICGSFFASGQLYVALSRCKSIKNIHLNKDLTKEELQVDEEAINLMSGLVGGIVTSDKQKVGD